MAMQGDRVAAPAVQFGRPIAAADGEEVEVVEDPDAACAKVTGSILPAEIGQGRDRASAQNPEPAPVSYVRLLCMTAAMYGIAFNWGAQYSRVTPILQELGMPASWLGIAWFAGPVSGIVVQPWVGFKSDRTTHWSGRRRIWMCVAMVGLAISNVLMAFALGVARLFISGESAETLACAIAVFAFWCADIFINMMQGPCRTLLVDLLPPSQLGLGNACLGIWEGLGKLSAFAVGSFPIGQLFPAWRAFSGVFFANVQIFFICGNLVMMISFAMTFAAAQETPLKKRPSGAPTDEQSFFALAAGVVRGLSPVSRWVWIALCCTNFAWFVSWMYIPMYMGVNIMGGDPDAPAETEAERRYFEGAGFVASQAMLGQSVLSLVLAPLMPKLMRLLGGANLWMVCECLHGLVYCATPLIRQRGLAVADLSLQGFAWAAFLVIPYTIMGREAKSESPGGEGLFMSVMNLALCFPEIVASVVVGPVLLLAGGRATGPIVMAGLVCFAACGVLAYVAKLERAHYKYEAL